MSITSTSRCSCGTSTSLRFCGTGASLGFCGTRRQCGFTLIELVIFMIVVGIGVVGLLGVMNNSIRTSADPLLQKQALSIAESLLAEIQRQPFSYCDPDDANATTAASSANCTASMSQDTLGGPIPAAETRSSYDNVTDYARAGGLVMNNVSDPSGTIVMTNYTATITLAWADATFGFAAGTHAAVGITVNVQNGPANVTLTGYRLRYAPQL